VEIDGGFEFDGQYFLHDDIRWKRPVQARLVLASATVEGDVPLGGRRFTRWLPPGRAEILVLRRAAQLTVGLTNVTPAGEVSPPTATNNLRH
jgi:hypothetical protein